MENIYLECIEEIGPVFMAQVLCLWHIQEFKLTCYVSSRDITIQACLVE
jgi:hypothetical protein